MEDLSPLQTAALAALDPTANVLQLVQTAIKRQDDLRLAAQNHVNEIMELRAIHYREMRDAESERLDAIRAVDVNAVNRAAEVASTKAQTLADQVSQSAEALRTQVAAAATAATVALAAALEPIIKDIADLRRAQYEAQGQKTQVIETKSSNAALWQAVGVILAGVTVVASVLFAVLKP